MLIGLVGKPNAGKSTFFKALTLADVEIANYPFATIKPNVGVGYAKTRCVDQEFGKQCNPREGFCVDHYRFLPVQVIDVAGLVPGAHLGKGMGNEFLNDLNQADALIHVIDAAGATNEKGEPVNPLSYDPANDIRFLEEELDLWFLKILKSGWEKVAKTARVEKESTVKAITKQMSGLRVTDGMVKKAVARESFPDDLTRWNDHELMGLASSLRRLAKPIVVAANKCDVPGAGKNVERLRKEFPKEAIVACSAEAEIALKEAARKELVRYVPGASSFSVEGKVTEQQVAGLKVIEQSILGSFGSTGVQEVVDRVVFDVLKCIPVYPGSSRLVDKDGNVLHDCFLFKQGSTANDFAFHIHSDIGKNFVKAVNVKTKQVVGRDYVLQKGDVIEIMTR